MSKKKFDFSCSVCFNRFRLGQTTETMEMSGKKTFLGTIKGHNFREGENYGYSDDDEIATFHECCERCGLEFIDTAYKNHDYDREILWWVPHESYLLFSSDYRQELPYNSFRKIADDDFLTLIPPCVGSISGDRA